MCMFSSSQQGRKHVESKRFQDNRASDQPQCQREGSSREGRLSARCYKTPLRTEPCYELVFVCMWTARLHWSGALHFRVTASAGSAARLIHSWSRTVTHSVSRLNMVSCGILFFLTCKNQDNYCHGLVTGQSVTKITWNF